MSENEQKPGKILRTSSGRTRLTASGGSDAEEPGAPEAGAPEAPAAEQAVPAVPEAAPPQAGPGQGAAGQGSAGASPAGPSSGAGEGPAAGGSGPVGSGPASAPEAPGAGSSGPGASGSGPATKVSSASKGMRLTASGGETQVQPAVDSSQFGSGPAAPAVPKTGSGGGQQAAASEGMLPGGVKASSGGVKMKGRSSKKGPRTVRLTAANIDPWSVMKMSFLLSLAIAIAMLVATLVLWLVLQATGVIGTVETTMEEIAGAESAESLVGLISLGRVMATAFVLALVNIVLMTALSTLFAFLYNIGASIVGGFHLTLTDE